MRRNGENMEETYDFLTRDMCLEIMGKLDNAMLIIDLNHNIRFINEAYEKRFHVKKEKILGRKLTDFETNTTIERAIKTGEVYTYEVEFLKSLNIDTVGISFPIKKDGDVVGAAAVFCDTTSYIELASRLQHTQEMNDYLIEQLENPMVEEWTRQYVSINKKMKTLIGKMTKVAKTDASVMILGESGVGKEVAAKLIHDSSLRCDGPYVKVNCAAIPENLLESELFGYVGGAFTGAKKEGKPGKFELAQKGTIFLDEIGDMEMSMQVKLLRVLQEKEVERIGGTKPISLDIRVIAATNQNLEQLIREGKFRRDLYYRLHVIEIPIPPLRERRDDIPLLTHHFLNKMVGPNVHLSPKTSRILNNYDWPGNVRELINVLEHACIMRANDQMIDSNALPEYLRPKDNFCEKFGDTTSYNIHDMVAELERELIQEAVKKFPNKTKAIEELGISRRSFYEKVKKYEIEVGEE